MIVEDYIREDGSRPFGSWFNDLDPQAATKVATAMLRLEMGNTSNVKWIGGGLGEYRIDWGPGYRLYLTQDGDTLIVLRGRNEKTAAGGYRSGDHAARGVQGPQGSGKAFGQEMTA